MTTDERIENLEKGLASARRFNRWLLAAVGVALGAWLLAGTLGPRTAGAQAAGAAAPEQPQGLPRYQIAICDNSPPYVLDTYTGDIYTAPSAADARRWKTGPDKLQQIVWCKRLDGPPR
jgi:hypothetical protein